MNWKSILLIVTVVVGIMIEHTADACMVFRLKAGDGTVITGRSQEFIQDLKFDLIVVPRNMEGGAWGRGSMVAVGIPVTQHPPHRSFLLPTSIMPEPPVSSLHSDPRVASILSIR